MSTTSKIKQKKPHIHTTTLLMILSIRKILIQIIFKKSYKTILIYYIGYVTIKDSKYVKINSVNHSYLIFSKVNE